MRMFLLFSMLILLSQMTNACIKEKLKPVSVAIRPSLKIVADFGQEFNLVSNDSGAKIISNEFLKKSSPGSKELRQSPQISIKKVVADKGAAFNFMINDAQLYDHGLKINGTQFEKPFTVEIELNPPTDGLDSCRQEPIIKS